MPSGEFAIAVENHTRIAAHELGVVSLRFPEDVGEVGLVLPRYPEMRVIVGHRQGENDDILDLGATWMRGSAVALKPLTQRETHRGFS